MKRNLNSECNKEENGKKEQTQKIESEINITTECDHSLDSTAKKRSSSAKNQKKRQRQNDGGRRAPCPKIGRQR